VTSYRWVNLRRNASSGSSFWSGRLVSSSRSQSRPPGTEGSVKQRAHAAGRGQEHRLTVTDIRAGKPGISYPRYIAGEKNGPPEDCGGIPGLYELLDAIADPAYVNSSCSRWSCEANPQQAKRAADGWCCWLEARQHLPPPLDEIPQPQGSI
jgi:hypothetical protein